MIHKIRTERKNEYEEVNLTRKTAIFAFCKECVGFVVSEVEKCTDTYCPLYPFRNNAAVKGTSTRTSNPKAVEALKAYHINKKKRAS